jgi:teichuronic acid biosynthesis glycosyltransferase TuaC
VECSAEPGRPGQTDAVTILWVVEGYPWEGHPVAGVFFRTQAHALARRGVRVVVATPTPWSPWPLSRVHRRWRRYANAPAFVEEGGVTVIRPRYVALPGEPSWGFPDRLMARAVFREQRLWEGARLVHGHTVVTALAAWRLARRARLPFVITFHGGDLNTWPERHPDRLSELRAAANDARAVITVSADLAARARELTGVDAIHLPLGSDHRGLAALRLPRDDARAALRLPQDRIIVLFVGNLLAAKGVRELADGIVASGNPFLGVFVGDGPLKGYGMDDPRNVDLLDYRGARPHEEIARYMSAADVLVLPSHSEGLPTVLVEAGSLELPVIASTVGGIPGLLADHRGTLLKEVSSDAIAAALADFRGSRPAAQAAAARFRKFVIAEHDVEVNAGRLLDYYGL